MTHERNKRVAIQRSITHIAEKVKETHLSKVLMAANIAFVFALTLFIAGEYIYSMLVW